VCFLLPTIHTRTYQSNRESSRTTMSEQTATVGTVHRVSSRAFLLILRLFLSPLHSDTANNTTLSPISCNSDPLICQFYDFRGAGVLVCSCS